MRLKKFNEMNSAPILDGLDEFLEDYFVEFSDMGFIIESEYNKAFSNNVWLDVSKKSSFFEWYDVKDTFIPFPFAFVCHW
jgi:hypothetical protein